MRLPAPRTIPALLHNMILRLQEPRALDGPLPPGAKRERHRLEGQAPEDHRMECPVVEGHLLEATRLESLRLEDQTPENISLDNLVLQLGRGLEGLVLGYPVLEDTVQCPALLLLIASKALTESLSKELTEGQKDRRGLKVLRDRRARLDSPDYQDYKDSRDREDFKDRKGIPDLKDKKGLRGDVDFKDCKVSKDREASKVHEVSPVHKDQQGWRAKARIFQRTSCLKPTMSSLKA